MLEIFTVLRDKGRAEFGKLVAELRDDFGADEIFDGLLGACVRVDVYLKLG